MFVLEKQNLIKFLKDNKVCASYINWAKKQTEAKDIVEECPAVGWLYLLIKAIGGQLWAEYEEKKAPLRAEYEKQKALLLAEYREKKAPFWAEYKNKIDLINAEYMDKYNVLAKEVCTWERVQRAIGEEVRQFAELLENLGGGLTKNLIIKFIEENKTNSEYLNWAQKQATARDIVERCPNNDWLIWLLAAIGGEISVEFNKKFAMFWAEYYKKSDWLRVKCNEKCAQFPGEYKKNKATILAEYDKQSALLLAECKTKIAVLIREICTCERIYKGITKEYIMETTKTQSMSNKKEVRSINPKTGGEKGVKLARFDLIPVGPLTELAELYGKGAMKYAERNFEKGYDWSKSYAAMQRHANAFWDGEDFDNHKPDCPEGCLEHTEVHHLTAVNWHAFALRLFTHLYPEGDDRAHVIRNKRAAKKENLNE